MCMYFMMREIYIYMMKLYYYVNVSMYETLV